MTKETCYSSVLILFFCDNHLSCLFSEFAAQYIPLLFEAWTKNTGAINSHACMLNFLVGNGNPYFRRFIRQPVAAQ